MNGFSKVSVNRLTIGTGYGTVEICSSSIARYIDVVPRDGSRRLIPGKCRLGLSDDLDRRVRRSNDAEPNCKQYRPPKNPSVRHNYPHERN